jgi:hypothetical protein
MHSRSSLVTSILIAVALAGQSILSAASYAKSSVDSQTTSERQLAGYMQMAFGRNDGLVKFELSPELAIVCHSAQECDGVLPVITDSMPTRAKFSVLQTASDKADVLLLFSDEQESKISNDISTAHPQWRKTTLGNDDCRLTQWAIGDSIQRLIVFAEKNEGDILNSYCFLTEILRGSGLNPTWTYESLKTDKSLQSREQLQTFERPTAVLLAIHWSVAVSPGANKLSTYNILKAWLNR